MDIEASFNDSSEKRQHDGESVAQWGLRLELEDGNSWGAYPEGTHFIDTNSEGGIGRTWHVAGFRRNDQKYLIVSESTNGELLRSEMLAVDLVIMLTDRLRQVMFLQQLEQDAASPSPPSRQPARPQYPDRPRMPEHNPPPNVGTLGRISGFARRNFWVITTVVASAVAVGLTGHIAMQSNDRERSGGNKKSDPVLVKSDEAPKNEKLSLDGESPLRTPPDLLLGDAQDRTIFFNRKLQEEQRLMREPTKKDSFPLELVGISPHDLADAGIGFLCGKIVVEGKDGKRQILDHEKGFPTMFTRDPATQKAHVGRGETKFELWQHREEWEREHKDDLRIFTTPDAIHALARRGVIVSIQGKTLTVEQQNPMLGKSVNEPLYGSRHGRVVMHPKDGTVSILMKGENIECLDDGGNRVLITKDGLVQELGARRTQKLEPK